MTAFIFRGDAIDAIRDASARAPCCIGYRQGAGWFVYDATEGCPKGDRPEFFMPRQGIIPVALNEIAKEVWLSVVCAAIYKVTK